MKYWNNAVPGGAAACPLRIQPDGVYVQTEGGYRKL